ncbi:translocation/assembly module TamB domain-containing protein [uncultured Desulfovibrio sp.]|uniref:translocation/assembly module TamB domain-containing protein n=1 Tax=uncultured Desulfovibrio sp. TaxID=167968 RepID=UPI002672802E|nr:translocation/assembly module TamB [uncultured Desulfovibrio sp.]
MARIKEERPASPTPQSSAAVQDGHSGRPRHPKRWTRWLRRALAVLLVLLLAALGGVAWVLRSESGQAWLTETVNAALESSLRESGLHVRLTHLSGPLPFACSFGLEAADAQGVWLTAPENSFAWDWHALPGTVRIASIRSVNPALRRLPDLPPAPEPPVSQPPLTVEGLRVMLGDAARVLNDLPGWLPAVHLDALSVENALLPSELLGGAATPPTPDPAKAQTPERKTADAPAPAPAAQALRADLDAGLTAGGEGAKLHVRARLSGAEEAPFAVSVLSCAAAEVSLEAQAGPSARANKGTDKGPGNAAEPGPGLAVDSRLEAVLRRPVLHVDALPPDLLGSEARLSLALEGGTAARESGPASSARLALADLNLTAGRVTATGQGQWHSGREDWPDGPLDLSLNVNLQSPATDTAAVPAKTAEGTEEAGDVLAMLRAPLSLTLTAKGALRRPDVDLRLACADIQSNGHALKDTTLALTGAPLAWGDALGLDGARGEARLVLDLRAELDQRPLSLTTELFYGPDLRSGPENATGVAPEAAVAGLRKLRLGAAGLEGTGDVAAVLTPGKAPVLDGAIRLRVADWQALSAFVPGQRLDGEAGLDLELRVEAPQNGSGPGAQQVLLRWKIPRFNLSSAQGGDAALHVRGLDGEARLTDLFGRAALAARLDLEGVNRGDLRLSARARASGPLQGPLDLNLESSGGVTSRLNIQWRPGLVALQTLEVRLNAALAAGNSGKGSKGRALGLRATRGAEIRYGDAGLAVSGLDLALSPSGRLQAQGALAPEKLDLRVVLDGLALEPWRALVPALPLGTAEARVRLSGSPARPGGDFRLGVRRLRVPGSPVAPLDLALVGGIERGASGSALAARLELDPQAVKALGGSEARLNLRLPLLFGPDGLPKPAPRGQLAGQVRWEGAVGPVWSLLPLADRRLNGRISLNLDLGGTLAAPRVTGGLRVDKARYEDLVLGVLLTDINLRLDLNGKEAGKKNAAGGTGPLAGSMHLELSAADGLGGSLRLTGGGGLDGRNLDLRAVLDHLRPLRRRDLRINLSGQAQVTGSATAPDVRGEIVINQGALLLNNLAVGGSITTLPIQEAATVADAAPAAPAAAAEGQGSLNLRIRAPGRFIVEGHGLTSEWQANLLVSGSPVAPMITGELRAVKGNFDFLTKNFALTRGVITFGGGSLSNPLLDIVMTNETPDLTAHITISGTVSKMKLSLSSEPSLPKDEILSRILFGRSANELSRLEALQLAGAVAQLAGFGSGGGGMLDFTRKALGVDVLRLGTSSTGAAGEPGDQTAGGTTLEMGKYIGDLIYVGVEQGMKPDSTAFIIQLELTPRINLELRTEQQDTWGGVRWKYNY